MKKMDAYNESNEDMIKEFVKDTHEQSLAYIVLEYADQNEYGSLMTELRAQGYAHLRAG
jgi:hypothetical protein